MQQAEGIGMAGCLTTSTMAAWTSSSSSWQVSLELPVGMAHAKLLVDFDLQDSLPNVASWHVGLMLLNLVCFLWVVCSFEHHGRVHCLT